MTSETFELNCPFCDKLYKLPREKVIKHAGKSIHCRRCGKPFTIPSLPPEETIEDADHEAIPDEPVAEPVSAEHAIAAPAASFIAAAPFAEPRESPAEEPAPELEPDSPHVEAPTHAESPAFESHSWEAPALHAADDTHSTEAPFATDRIDLEPPPLAEYGESAAPAEPDSFGAPEHLEDPLSAPIAGVIQDFADTSGFLPDASAAEEARPSFDADFEPFKIPTEEPVGEKLSEEPSEEPDYSELVPFNDLPHERKSDLEHRFTAAEPDESPDEPFERVSESPEEDVQEESLEPPAPPVTPAPRIPPPPPAPSPMLPRQRRGARTLVSPVFVAEPEEPEPRRRGRFGGRAEPVVPAEVLDEAIESDAIAPTLIDEVTEEDAFESVQHDKPVKIESLTPDEDETSPEPEAMETLADSESAMPSLTPMAAQAPDDWSAIRRSLGLLAVMSVIATLVLIAILLTELGIIPKK